jgi:hypothetical protein
MSELKIFDHHEIDKTLWDNLVDVSPISFPYWRSWYLDIVSPGWKAVISGNYDFVLPLPHRKKGGIKYVYPPEYTQQLGVFGKDFPTSQLVTQMVEQATKSFKYLELNLNKKNKVDFIDASLKKRRNFELSLNNSYENLYADFHRNTKRNIKKCAKENLVVSTGRSPVRIIETFNDNKAKQLKQQKNLDYEMLEKLIGIGLEKNVVEIKHVHQDDTYLGGAVFFNEKERKVFLFSALSAEGRKKRAMFCLINSVIQENAKSNLTLDFEGSDDKNLGNFYQRFGATERLYLYLKINRLPRLIRWLKN